MTENLRLNINNSIHWLHQHNQKECDFSSKKNDQLLQNLVSDLIHFSETKRSSDIHIEPQENAIRIRLRIDGVLSEQFQLPKYILEQLNCKLKIMANIDIAQNRLPQDGKFIFNAKNGIKTHIRVSTCPTIQGEKIVLRLLKDNRTSLQLESLGMNPSQLNNFSQAISDPHGLILITGPTGSGKTSTVYSALTHINANTKNIMTIEDPVEVYIPGVNQININLKSEMSFASALRSILRQDPDVIMIGEIRDEETAQIAIKAANTGHLVLATLHTNNCMETINRLRQMKIDHNEFISCLRLIVAQRLLRKKCLFCKAKSLTTECQCSDGYDGRHGIFESISLNEQMRSYIIENPHFNESDLIKNFQFYPLKHQALEYISLGITTPEEVKRVFNT